MQLVEKLADRLLLIDRGSAVLSGTLDEIRRSFGADEKLVLTLDRAPDLAAIAREGAVAHVAATGEREVALHLRTGASLGEVLATLARHYGITAVRSERISLHDIYVQAIRARTGAAA
jgi:ABC-2 type transport system ATP-binding protein